MRAVKYVALILTALLFCLSLILLPQQLVFEGGESYTFYVGNTSADCREVKADAETAALTKLSLKDVCGESAFYTSLDVSQFIESQGGRIIFTERLSDSVNYYCSAPLPYSVKLYGKEINLHVCVKADGVTVASPIIFGGY